MCFNLASLIDCTIIDPYEICKKKKSLLALSL